MTTEIEGGVIRLCLQYLSSVRALRHGVGTARNVIASATAAAAAISSSSSLLTARGQVMHRGARINRVVDSDPQQSEDSARGLKTCTE